jgi:hypothetical protein
MNNYPISLDKIFFTKMHVEAIAEFKGLDKNKLTHTPENKLHVSTLDESGRKFSVSMSTTFNKEKDSKDPYCIEIECIGIFSADTTLTLTEAIRHIQITAHSVLYGAIRESVLWITGRQPYGPFQLGLSILQAPPPNAINQEN